MHFHLDLVGGMAGDMFVGAMLDLYPQHIDGTISAIRQAGVDDAIGLAHRAFTDGILSGGKFFVDIPEKPPGHDHVHWSTLRKSLQQCDLPSAVRERAIAIFSELADAEARVHQKSVDEVAFHEVGAWDSIADIVAAAYLIEAQDASSWSIGAIPIGNGRVKTQHGLLPAPAPATTLLLEGYPCFDDGFTGERVTPTGAAIIKHLQPALGIGTKPRRLQSCGYGFGTRKMPGISNVLRVLEFSNEVNFKPHTDQVATITFEIDDQTAEDLALGLDRVRALDGVIDVIQASVVAKRGRQATHVQVLAKPEALQSVTDLCFTETTTIGLRVQINDRLILPRHDFVAENDNNVKIVSRPHGLTAKADIKGFEHTAGSAERGKARQELQNNALLNSD